MAVSHPYSTCFAKARCFKTGLTELPPRQDNSVQAYQGFGSSHLLLIQSIFLIFHPPQSINYTFFMLCRKVLFQFRCEYCMYNICQILTYFDVSKTRIHLSILAGKWKALWRLKGEGIGSSCFPASSSPGQQHPCQKSVTSSTVDRNHV